MEKSFKKLKNFLRQGKKIKKLKMSLKKRYGPSRKKLKELKNVLKKRYGPSGKKIKI